MRSSQHTDIFPVGSVMSSHTAFCSGFLPFRCAHDDTLPLLNDRGYHWCLHTDIVSQVKELYDKDTMEEMRRQAKESLANGDRPKLGIGWGGDDARACSLVWDNHARIMRPCKDFLESPRAR